MKILVLGSSGFVGKNLLLALPKEFEVTAVYNNSKYFLDFVNLNKLNCKALKCDLSSKDEVTSLLDKNYDVVVSLFSNPNPSESFNDPLYDFKSNALPIYNVLSSITAEHVIYFSSGLVYEDRVGEISVEKTVINPTIPYAISKFSAEQFVKLAHKKGNIGNYNIVRFWGAYGPYQSTTKIYSKLVKQFGIDKNCDFTIKGDGHSLISAMYIDDAIVEIMHLIKYNIKHDRKTYNFAYNKPMSVFNLVMEAAKTFNIDPRIKFEGQSYETIDFYPTDSYTSYQVIFTDVKQGLLKLYDWQQQHKELL